MKLITIFIFSFFLLLIPSFSYAVYINGIDYDMELTGKIMGTAGSSIALSDDVEACLYNPAGLSFSQNNVQAMMTYSRLWQNSEDYLSANILTTFSKFALGVSFINLGSDDLSLRETTEDILGSFSYNSSLIYLGLAYEVQQNLYFGIKAKAYYLSLSDYHKWALGLDAGILYKTRNPNEYSANSLQNFFKNFTLGLYIKNIVPYNMTLDQATDTYVLNPNFGISYNFPKVWVIQFNPILDFNFIQKELAEIHSGLETIIYDYFIIDAGYKFYQKTIGLGGGIDFHNIIVNYSISIIPIETINTMDVKIKF